MTESTNTALWLDSPGGSFRVGEAPMPVPISHEIVVRVRAVAVNPVDLLPGIGRRIVLPWLRYPTILGSDAAGEVVAVGPSVTRYGVGERVVGYALGSERSRNRASEGAFQTHVVLLEHMCVRIPGELGYAEAAVLPLAVTTAAAGLFEDGQLALRLPDSRSRPQDATVVVWGGSTSVGLNAIQLARSAGYDVIGTCSPRNFELLTELGASACFDYRDPDAVEQIGARLQSRRVAGVLAIGAGSLSRALQIASARGVSGSGRIASAYPTPVTRIRGVLARRRGLRVSAIWGGSPADNAVGPALWNDYLPDALADGLHRAAPAPLISGVGVAAIPAALARLRQGVSASKIVVTL